LGATVGGPFPVVQRGSVEKLKKLFVKRRILYRQGHRRQPFAKPRIACQPVCDYIRPALILSALDDAPPLRIRQMIQAREQGEILARFFRREQMALNWPRRRDFAGVESLNPVIAAQLH
jgi:hypothetical protein